MPTNLLDAASNALGLDSVASGLGGIGAAIQNMAVSQPQMPAAPVSVPAPTYAPIYTQTYRDSDAELEKRLSAIEQMPNTVNEQTPSSNPLFNALANLGIVDTSAVKTDRSIAETAWFKKREERDKDRIRELVGRDVSDDSFTLATSSQDAAERLRESRKFEADKALVKAEQEKSLLHPDIARAVRSGEYPAVKRLAKIRQDGALDYDAVRAMMGGKSLNRDQSMFFIGLAENAGDADMGKVLSNPVTVDYLQQLGGKESKTVYEAKKRTRPLLLDVFDAAGVGVASEDFQMWEIPKVRLDEAAPDMPAVSSSGAYKGAIDLETVPSAAGKGAYYRVKDLLRTLSSKESGAGLSVNMAFENPEMADKIVRSAPRGVRQLMAMQAIQKGDDLLLKMIAKQDEHEQIRLEADMAEAMSFGDRMQALGIGLGRAGLSMAEFIGQMGVVAATGVSDAATALPSLALSPSKSKWEDEYISKSEDVSEGVRVAYETLIKNPSMIAKYAVRSLSGGSSTPTDEEKKVFTELQRDPAMAVFELGTVLAPLNAVMKGAAAAKAGAGAAAIAKAVGAGLLDPSDLVLKPTRLITKGATLGREAVIGAFEKGAVEAALKAQAGGVAGKMAILESAKASLAKKIAEFGEAAPEVIAAKEAVSSAEANFTEAASLENAASRLAGSWLSFAPRWLKDFGAYYLATPDSFADAMPALAAYRDAIVGKGSAETRRLNKRAGRMYDYLVKEKGIHPQEAVPIILAGIGGESDIGAALVKSIDTKKAGLQGVVDSVVRSARRARGASNEMPVGQVLTRKAPMQAPRTTEFFSESQMGTEFDYYLASSHKAAKAIGYGEDQALADSVLSIMENGIDATRKGLDANSLIAKATDRAASSGRSVGAEFNGLVREWVDDNIGESLSQIAPDISPEIRNRVLDAVAIKGVFDALPMYGTDGLSAAAALSAMRESKILGPILTAAEVAGNKGVVNSIYSTIFDAMSRMPKIVEATPEMAGKEVAFRPAVGRKAVRMTYGELVKGLSQDLAEFASDGVAGLANMIDAGQITPAAFEAHGLNYLSRKSKKNFDVNLRGLGKMGKRLKPETRDKIALLASKAQEQRSLLEADILAQRDELGLSGAKVGPGAESRRRFLDGDIGAELTKQTGDPEFGKVWRGMKGKLYFQTPAGIQQHIKTIAQQKMLPFLMGSARADGTMSRRAITELLTKGVVESGDLLEKYGAAAGSDRLTALTSVLKNSHFLDVDGLPSEISQLAKKYGFKRASDNDILRPLFPNRTPAELSKLWVSQDVQQVATLARDMMGPRTWIGKKMVGVTAKYKWTQIVLNASNWVRDEMSNLLQWAPVAGIMPWSQVHKVKMRMALEDNSLTRTMLENGVGRELSMFDTGMGGVSDEMEGFRSMPSLRQRFTSIMRDEAEDMLSAAEMLDDIPRDGARGKQFKGYVRDAVKDEATALEVAEATDMTVSEVRDLAAKSPIGLAEKFLRSAKKSGGLIKTYGGGLVFPESTRFGAWLNYERGLVDFSYRTASAMKGVIDWHAKNNTPAIANLRKSLGMPADAAPAAVFERAAEAYKLGRRSVDDMLGPMLENPDAVKYAMGKATDDFANYRDKNKVQRMMTSGPASFFLAPFATFAMKMAPRVMEWNLKNMPVLTVLNSINDGLSEMIYNREQGVNDWKSFQRATEKPWQIQVPLGKDKVLDASSLGLGPSSAPNFLMAPGFEMVKGGIDMAKSEAAKRVQNINPDPYGAAPSITGAPYTTATASLPQQISEYAAYHANKWNPAQISFSPIGGRVYAGRPFKAALDSAIGDSPVPLHLAIQKAIGWAYAPGTEEEARRFDVKSIKKSRDVEGISVYDGQVRNALDYIGGTIGRTQTALEAFKQKRKVVDRPFGPEVTKFKSGQVRGLQVNDDTLAADNPIVIQKRIDAARNRVYNPVRAAVRNVVTTLEDNITAQFMDPSQIETVVEFTKDMEYQVFGYAMPEVGKRLETLVNKTLLEDYVPSDYEMKWVLQPLEEALGVTIPLEINGVDQTTVFEKIKKLEAPIEPSVMGTTSGDKDVLTQPTFGNAMSSQFSQEIRSVQEAPLERGEGASRRVLRRGGVDLSNAPQRALRAEGKATERFEGDIEERLNLLGSEVMQVFKARKKGTLNTL